LGYSQYHIDVSIVGIGENPWRNQCWRWGTNKPASTYLGHAKKY
jgi:hypothetical protein